MPEATRPERWNREPREQLRLLVLTHILPVPGSSGQQQRVRYTLEAARRVFHVTVLTFAAASEQRRVRETLSEYADASIVLPSLYSRSWLARWRHRVGSIAYALATGEKRNNYIVGRVELPPHRVAEAVGTESFDVAIFEYWYAAAAAAVLRNRSILTVLDMHNILWKAYQRRVSAIPGMPGWLRRRVVDRYRRREERSWREFDGIVAINREEETFVQGCGLRTEARIFYAPMGVDLSRWPYSWNPRQPPRVAFYGGLGSIANQSAALRCARAIMPSVWRRFPQAELWLVGADPPAQLRTLGPRVHVTGFVEDAGSVLGSMTAVLCPWSGRFGFRSRLVEVMALGVPVVATPDAVAGMDLQDGRGLLLGAGDEDLARNLLRLLEDRTLAGEQSRLARESVESLFGVQDTYGRWMLELSEWVREGRGQRA